MPKKPDLPFPGAAPTADPTATRNILVGRYGECTILGTVVAICFEWEVRVSFDTVNLSAHGDYWQIFGFLDAGWQARIRGYILPNTTAASYLLSSTIATSPTGSSIPRGLTFAGWNGPSAATASRKIWEGTCFIKEGSLSVPMALAEQEMTLIGTGIPTAGVTLT